MAWLCSGWERLQRKASRHARVPRNPERRQVSVSCLKHPSPALQLPCGQGHASLCPSLKHLQPHIPRAALTRDSASCQGAKSRSSS